MIFGPGDLMADIHCAICSEPWDNFGLDNGDVKAWEADMIRKGYGCPCCSGEDGKENYVKPPSLLHGNCKCCGKNCEIDQNNITLKKKIPIYDLDENWIYLFDDLYCFACYDRLVNCKECGKLIHEENSYFIQSLFLTLCEDCMDKVDTCTYCQETDLSRNMRYVDSKPYCSGCYGPDMEIQNESD
jgi:hypothetical protein